MNTLKLVGDMSIKELNETFGILISCLKKTGTKAEDLKDDIDMLYKFIDEKGW